MIDFTVEPVYLLGVIHKHDFSQVVIGAFIVIDWKNNKE